LYSIALKHGNTGAAVDYNQHSCGIQYLGLLPQAAAAAAAAAIAAESIVSFVESALCDQRAVYVVSVTMRCA
jgi:hypothetical protein